MSALIYTSHPKRTFLKTLYLRRSLTNPCEGCSKSVPSRLHGMHAMACHGTPWHALAYHGMPSHGIPWHACHGAGKGQFWNTPHTDLSGTAPDTVFLEMSASGVRYKSGRSYMSNVGLPCVSMLAQAACFSGLRCLDRQPTLLIVVVASLGRKI